MLYKTVTFRSELSARSVHITLTPKGKYKPAWGIHTGVKIIDRKIISVDTGEILAMRNHKLRILAYKNTQTFTTTWRKLL